MARATKFIRFKSTGIFRSTSAENKDHPDNRTENKLYLVSALSFQLAKCNAAFARERPFALRARFLDPERIANREHDLPRIVCQSIERRRTIRGHYIFVISDLAKLNERVARRPLSRANRAIVRTRRASSSRSSDNFISSLRIPLCLMRETVDGCE